MCLLVSCLYDWLYDLVCTRAYDVCTCALCACVLKCCVQLCLGFVSVGVCMHWCDVCAFCCIGLYESVCVYDLCCMVCVRVRMFC